MKKQIIELARECIDTPFVHQGRTCGKALDCAGVLVHVIEGLGFVCDDEKGYPRSPYKGLLEACLSRQPHLKEIHKSEVSEGDVVLFRIKREPQHIGIFTGKTLIHSYYCTGRVVEQSFRPWQNHITHAYRIVL
ncbi:MAG: NlpC/P60 family protein [Porticoccus sp.]|nr:NlpC/P60 family protein [Porticoccus sp.]